MITTISNIQVFGNHNFVVVVIYIIPSKVMYTMFDDISYLPMSTHETAEQQESESV